MGHVKVVETRAVQSVVQPTEYGHFPAVSELPDGGRCETRYSDFGEQRLRVAVTMDGSNQGEETKPERNRVIDILQQLAREEGTPMACVAQPEQADLIVLEKQGRAYLSPASGFLVPADSAPGDATKTLPPFFGPLPTDATLADWLRDRVTKIARARALVGLASAGAGTGEFIPSSIDVKAELIRAQPSPEGGKPRIEAVPWKNGWVLREGEIIGFRVTNQGRESVDVNLLFADCNYGITAVFPRPGFAADNRLPPGKELLLPRTARVTPANNKEHLVVIAVRSDAAGGLPINFSCLCQPGIERLRGPRSGEPAMGTPLGRLLENAFYAEGTTRGLEIGGLDDYALQVISWRVAGNPARPRP